MLPFILFSVVLRKASVLELLGGSPKWELFTKQELSPGQMTFLSQGYQTNSIKPITNNYNQLHNLFFFSKTSILAPLLLLPHLMNSSSPETSHSSWWPYWSPHISVSIHSVFLQPYSTCKFLCHQQKTGHKLVQLFNCSTSLPTTANLLISFLFLSNWLQSNTTSFSNTPLFLPPPLYRYRLLSQGPKIL